MMARCKTMWSRLEALNVVFGIGYILCIIHTKESVYYWLHINVEPRFVGRTEAVLLMVMVY